MPYKKQMAINVLAPFFISVATFVAMLRRCNFYTSIYGNNSLLNVKIWQY